MFSEMFNKIVAAALLSNDEKKQRNISTHVVKQFCEQDIIKNIEKHFELQN